MTDSAIVTPVAPARPASLRSVFGVILGLAAANPATVAAQQPPPAASAAAPYKLLRYEEDYRNLRDPTARVELWDPLKYIPLDDRASYLSLGGELRERFEYYSYPDFGLRGQRPDAYLLHRLLLHADIHLGENLRGFVQLGNHLAPWKDAAAPPYLDRLNVQQAFVDVRLPFSADVDPVLRMGRQEMVFGSQRLIAVRDAPSVRRSFDGFRLGDTIGDVRVDAFLTRPVLLRNGVFDDPSNRAQALWGIYATAPLGFARGANIDLYYLGFRNKLARFADGPGDERRHSIGMRLFGAAGGWDWDLEALGQFGSFGRQDIRAWTVATNSGYSLDILGARVRVGVKADIASGDRNAQDGKLGTFNAMFPKLAYLSSAALFAPANLIDVQPTLSIKPMEALTVSFGYDFLWRATTADAVYIGAGVPVAGTAGRPGRYTGRSFSVDAVWQVGRHILIEAGYVRVDVAKALRAAGGRDVDFTYVAATYRF
ncbi:MAG: alginate export family protein [Alphaproteobacteria bacterium]